ncbi:(4Fe-4S)-binding protein [Streptomyces sp. NA02950]|uniref:(4Fe-4S)-binding protein n=1 Tax=Streptomyces sp. NA02950 TaxID=2742137 RepID=UPI0015928FC5|nr:(4Fe-4S)-binding protein [Streptomyces sp. NA02950]QKV91785.1 (4Fe-4S)-binding protein [Streptomyces sp. NA02950]
MDNERGKPYVGAMVTVSYEAERCLHAGECARALPQVFDPERRPWIQADGAPADVVAEVVRRCTSGALRYRMANGRTEQPDRPTALARRSSGQILVRGDLMIETPDGARKETRATLCGCGATGNDPYCDGAGPCGTRPGPGPTDPGPGGRGERQP